MDVATKSKQTIFFHSVYMFANVEVAGYLINSLTVYFPFFFAPDMMMISLKKKIVPL